MERHDQLVSALSTCVRQIHDRKEAFRIYHGSTNSTRQSQYIRARMVDTSALTQVIAVDNKRMVALVEPNVPMDALVKKTLSYGMVPPVVMEFPGITTGGGFAGTSGESSSFKYGFFDRTINWIEIVLATGEVVRASPTERADLFYGAASSFGTLGVTTLLELQLIKAKPYVELTYQPILSIDDGVQRIKAIIQDPTVDYLDGILYSATKGVLCTGRLADRPKLGTPTQRFTRATDPWFYLHVEKLISANPGKPTSELIPLTDYLFRYDRGGFWMARYSYNYFMTPFNRITRFLLDYFMHTRVMYHALHQSGLSNAYIIQDVAIPYERTTEFARYLDSDFGHYPIWLCPLKQTGLSGAGPRGLMASNSKPNSSPLTSRSGTGKTDDDMILNFGVWGPGPKSRASFVFWNRAFERTVQSLGGQKWLYAHAYYTEEEFYEIYDRGEYEALRKKYGAEYLPSVYDKVKVNVASEESLVQGSWKLWLLMWFWSIWPLAGLYGVYKTLWGGDYLLPKARRWGGGKVKGS